MSDLDLCEQPQATQQSVLNRSGKDKFLLILNLPQILRKKSKENPLYSLDPLQVSIHGTVVPTIQVPAVEVGFGGQVLNVSSYARPNYSPLSVNFIIDNKFTNYWILWEWLAHLNDPKLSKYKGINNLTPLERTELGNLSEYQANLTVLGLNEYNQKIIEFNYYNAFITTLGSINYSYRDPEIIEATAEFQFSQLDIKLLNKK